MNEHAPNQKAKTELLKELFQDSKLYEAIGPAWPLYLWLVLFGEGSVLTTYAGIAASLNCSKKTVRNRLAALKRIGVASFQQTGRGLRISLVGPHLTAGKASDRMPTEIMKSDPLLDDPEERLLLDEYRTAKAGKKLFEIRRVV